MVAPTIIIIELTLISVEFVYADVIMLAKKEKM